MRIKIFGVLLCLGVFLLIMYHFYDNVNVKKPVLSPEQINVLNELETSALSVISRSQLNDGSFNTLWTDRSLFYGMPNAELQVDIFLPVLIYELLEPYATNLTAKTVRDKIKAWLRTQIRDDGLVHYGTDDTALPPDSDSTALVLRILDEHPSEQVLNTLSAFKNDQGLYRIWLQNGGIPQHDAVGVDPNPVDLLVQVHLFLFFKKHMPTMAKSLLKSLKNFKKWNAPALWPYYLHAGWLFKYREIELQDNGLDIKVPDVVVQNTYPDQQIYFKLVTLIRNLSLGTGLSEEWTEAYEMLIALARDNFSQLRENPILLYHNDPSSNIFRHYWSNTLTFALWLNLKRLLV